MNQILRCDWLPKRARWSYLARSGLPAVSRKKNFPENHVINPLLTKLVPSRWLDIGLVLFFASLWTLTPSRSIDTQKKNLANIQPSWPHTWSVTHTYSTVFSYGHNCSIAQGNRTKILFNMAVFLVFTLFVVSWASLIHPSHP